MPADSFGYDESGNRVGVTDFDYDAIDRDETEAREADVARAQCEAITGLLEFLTAGRRPGRAGALAVGRDVITLAHVLSRQPQTQAALAKRLGVSQSLVCAKLKAMNHGALLKTLGNSRARKNESDNRGHR